MQRSVTAVIPASKLDDDDDDDDDHHQVSGTERHKEMRGRFDVDDDLRDDSQDGQDLHNDQETEED